MIKRFAAALLVLALPGGLWAQPVPAPQKSPDRLLPAGSQVYMRWDGFEGHKKEYDQTAIAKTMKGDLGKFVRTIINEVGDKLELLATSGQVDREVLQQFRDDCGGFLETVGKHGFSIGIEIRSLEPLEVQAIIVLPKSGAEQKSLLSLLRNVSKFAKQEVKSVKVGQRKMEHLEAGPVHIVWWSENQDAVLAIGTDGPAALAKRLGGGLSEQPLYKEVVGFKEFPTWGRGYIDLAGLLKVARTRGKEVSKLLDDLGLDSLKNMTFHSGFDGPAELAVVELNVQGERKGLLSLFSKKKFSLADLPPMPHDVGTFSASAVEMSRLYPVLAQASEAVVRLVVPDKVELVKDYLQRADDITGISLKDDLFGSFGDMMASYSVWAEGPLGLGAVTLFKVKDGGKLNKSLEAAIKGLGKLGLTVEVKQSKYHGVDLTQITVGGGGLPISFPVGYYTIHKGWFAFSGYPQGLQGYVLRANKELPTWRPSEEQQKALEPFPKEFVGISMSDPRPTIKGLLSVTPLIITYVNTGLQFLGGPGIDPTLVPNAYEATRYLFPNVTVTTDDGTKVRSVTRSSLALPF